MLMTMMMITSMMRPTSACDCVEILKITQNSFPVQPNCRQPQRCTAPLSESYPRIVQVEKWELTNEIWKVNIEKWMLTTNTKLKNKSWQKKVENESWQLKVEKWKLTNEYCQMESWKVKVEKWNLKSESWTSLSVAASKLWSRKAWRGVCDHTGNAREVDDKHALPEILNFFLANFWFKYSCTPHSWQSWRSFWSDGPTWSLLAGKRSSPFVRYTVNGCVTDPRTLQETTPCLTNVH